MVLSLRVVICFQHHFLDLQKEFLFEFGFVPEIPLPHFVAYFLEFFVKLFVLYNHKLINSPPTLSESDISNYMRQYASVLSLLTPGFHLPSFRPEMGKRTPREEILSKLPPPEPEKIARYLVLSTQKWRK